jgi:16S rRNA (cytosine967-C5)-methyltransferase
MTTDQSADESPVTPDARAVALEALVRIERDGAYANLALPAALTRTDLSDRDRAFATELVYGTLRMRRACDWLTDRFVRHPPDLPTRTALRLGAYQLAFLGTPAHAAVGATVAVAPEHTRPFVNAVLRRVAKAPVEFPDDATRLSYPDWIVGRLAEDLGEADALAALAHMDLAPRVRMRSDGYIQDQASEWMAGLVDAAPGMRIADVCAAPGGKATAMAATGATVLASDVREARVRTMAGNIDAIAGNESGSDESGGRAVPLVADGRRPPYRPGSFERVLVDAPCSGLGVLRRRPDARWRIAADDEPRLAALQRALVDAAVELVAPGGWLVYGVCTLTKSETIAIDEHLAERHPSLVALDPPPAPWRPHGRGGLLLPQDADTDGMFVLRLRRP